MNTNSLDSKEFEKNIKLHRQRLRQQKPKDYVDDPKTTKINKGKTRQLEKQKEKLIEQHNTILINKIHNVFGYFKPEDNNSSLNRKKINEERRRRQQKKRQQENKKIQKTLEGVKPTIKIDDERELERAIISTKNIQLKKKKSVNYKLAEPHRIQKEIDGHPFTITLQWEGNKKLLIVGKKKVSKSKEYFKVIELEESQAIGFIQQECNDDILEIVDHLRYDDEEKILYLVGNEILTLSEVDSSDEELDQMDN